MALRRPKRPARRTQTRAVDPHGIARYLFPFLEWSAMTGCTERTVYKRETALRRFIAWCDERDLDRPQAITKPIVERYQRHLFHYRKPGSGAPLSYGTQVSLLVPVRSFFKWLARDNHILYNPASELTLPHPPRQLPRTVLSVPAVERILRQPNLETPQGVRDRAMMETLYSTGMRRMELIRLKLLDLDWHRRVVFIREGKGRRDRYVPIGERALGWIARYRDEVRPLLVAGTDGGMLFLNDTGLPYSVSAIGYHVKKHIARAGLEVTGACHLFRHACATHMLEGGADVRFVQAMLGHANLSTTEIYTHVAINTLQAVHAATHPAEAETATTDIDDVVSADVALD